MSIDGYHTTIYKAGTDMAHAKRPVNMQQLRSVQTTCIDTSNRGFGRSNGRLGRAV